MRAKKLVFTFVMMLVALALIYGCEEKYDKYDEKGEKTIFQKDDDDKKDDKDKEDIGFEIGELDPLVEWTYTFNGSTFYYGSPVLSSDEETIYLGTSFRLANVQSENDKLLALNRDGTTKWEFDTNKGEVRSTPAVYKEFIYLLADYNRYGDDKSDMFRERADLIAVNVDGTKAWSKQVSGNGRIANIGLSEIVIYNDKVLVVTDRLYVFDYRTGDILYSSGIIQEGYFRYIRPVLHTDKVYFLIEQDLYEFNMASLKVYKLTEISDNLSVIEDSSNGIRFDSNGNMYTVANRYFISLDKDMHFRWLFDIGADDIYFRSTPFINEASGELYVGTKANEKSQFIALDISDGSILWSYDTGKDVYCSPTMDKNGLIYVA